MSLNSVLGTDSLKKVDLVRHQTDPLSDVLSKLDLHVSKLCSGIKLPDQVRH